MNPMHEQQQDIKKRIVSLLDLTNLEEDATADDIVKLCQKAITPIGNVAAVCIPAKFIALAKQHLSATGICIATVANFPTGTHPLPAIMEEIEFAIAAGADEIDIVIPFHLYLEDKAPQVAHHLANFVAACADRIRLKIILETGELQRPQLIAQASLDAITAGADFIKTSTGKVAVGATLEAAEIMLTAIKHAAKTVGFKASGGIRTVEQAIQYLKLAEKIMHPDWVSPQHFRFGASSLLNELIGNDLSTDSRIANY